MDNKTPLVTVVIPVYNGAAYIGEAVSSVIAQSFDDWELVLVNDGSKDDSLEIISELSKNAPRLNVITQANAGQASARNRGAAAARGKYVAFLDQDDYFAKRHLEYLVDFLENNEDFGMAYNDAEVVDEWGNRMYNQGASPFPPEDSPPKSIFDCLKKDLCILPGTVMILRSIYEKVGGFDESLVGFEDDHLFVRIFQKTKFGRTYKAGLFYRQHGSNTSLNTEIMCKSRILFYEKIKILLPDDNRRGISYSRAVGSRLALAMLYDLYRVRFINDRLGLWTLYRSYRAIKTKSFKYQVVTLLVHPYFPMIFIKIAIALAKLFRIM